MSMSQSEFFFIKNYYGHQNFINKSSKTQNFKLIKKKLKKGFKKIKGLKVKLC